MRRILKLALLLLVVLAAAYGVFDFLFPAQFARAAVNAERTAAGLQRKETSIPGLHVVYLEGGYGKTLLLLHGFGADKDNWTRVARYLTPHFHVFALDLPGYGESSHLAPERARVEDQMSYLSQIAAALKLNHFNLGGSSMGGHIAAAYAAAHPDQIDSLWLLAPSGVSTAQSSDLQNIIRSGNRMPLIAHDQAEYQELLDFVFVHRPYVPHAIIEMLARRQAHNYDFDQKVFSELMNSAPLEPQVKDLRTRTLVVWGDHDRALHYSGAEILHKLMPNSQVIIMPDIGHLPMLEAPAQTAQDYIRFRESRH